MLATIAVHPQRTRYTRWEKGAVPGRTGFESMRGAQLVSLERSFQRGRVSGQSQADASEIWDGADPGRMARALNSQYAEQSCDKRACSLPQVNSRMRRVATSVSNLEAAWVTSTCGARLMTDLFMLRLVGSSPHRCIA